MTDASATRELIQSLPKTETHLHVEGALPWELLERKNPAKYSEQPVFRSEGFRYDSFEQFESILIDHALDWFDSPESYHEAAKLIFSKHLEQNVKYVETSFHAGMMEFLKIPGEEIHSFRSASGIGSACFSRDQPQRLHRILGAFAGGGH